MEGVWRGRPDSPCYDLADHHQGLIRADDLPFPDVDLQHLAGSGGHDVVLHLHRLQNRNHVANPDRNLDDQTLHRCRYCAVARSLRRRGDGFPRGCSSRGPDLRHHGAGGRHADVEDLAFDLDVELGHRRRRRPDAQVGLLQLGGRLRRGRLLLNHQVSAGAGCSQGRRLRGFGGLAGRCWWRGLRLEQLQTQGGEHEVGENLLVSPLEPPLLEPRAGAFCLRVEQVRGPDGYRLLLAQHLTPDFAVGGPWGSAVEALEVVLQFLRYSCVAALTEHVVDRLGSDDLPDGSDQGRVAKLVADAWYLAQRFSNPSQRVVAVELAMDVLQHECRHLVAQDV